MAGQREEYKAGGKKNILQSRQSEVWWEAMQLGAIWGSVDHPFGLSIGRGENCIMAALLLGSSSLTPLSVCGFLLFMLYTKDLLLLLCSLNQFLWKWRRFIFALQDVKCQAMLANYLLGCVSLKRASSSKSHCDLSD